MEFEDQEEQEEEMELAPSYDSLGNSGGRPKTGGEASQGGRRPRYRECLKNHAVGIAGHALDGCGEFLAAGAEGSPDALKCAACNCHHSFHRKETDSGGVGDPYGSIVPQHHYASPPQFSPYYWTPAGYVHVQRPLALPSTSGGGGSQSLDEEDVLNSSGGGGGGVGRRLGVVVEEEVQNEVHAGAEGEDAGAGGEVGVEDSETGRGCGPAVLQRKKIKKGDVLLVDNLAVLHSRASFTPPRRVLASLCM